MPSWKKIIVSGSAGELSSLYAPSITGSLQGTSSYALSSLTASYAETASFSLATTENRILVINKSGTTITKGMVVHLTGSSNSSDTPYVTTASYESDGLSANTLGVATQNIAFNSTGYVTTEGVLTGINVTGFVTGQLLYLGATGSIIGTAPQAPLHSVRLGQVVRDSPSNNGSIYVRIDNGYELNELHDILETTTTSSFGDLLVKSGSVWTNSRQLTGSYGLIGSLTVTGSTSTDLVRITQTGTGNAFVVEDSANPDLYPFVITKDGDVGIGTLTPRRELDVDGIIYCNEIWNTQGYFLGDLDAGASNVYLTGDGASSTNSYLDLATNASTKLRITHAGNVGIGTLTPNARLDVNGNAIISGSMVIGSSSLGPFENTLTLGARDSVNEGGQLGFNAPGGSYTSASFIDLYQNRLRILKGTNAGSTGEVARWDMHTGQMGLSAYTAASSFTGTAAGYLAFDSSGNIITTAGVGGSPFPYTGNAVITGSLTVTQPIYVPINGGMYLQGGDDAALYDINVSNHMGIYGVQDSTVASVKLGSGGGIISGKSGNIGIGTTTPSAILHIDNSYNTNNTASFLVENSESGPFVIDAAGNVGIGTTTPTVNLDVNGAARINDLVIQNDLTVSNALYAAYGVLLDSGSSILYSVSTSSYDGAWFEYTARSGSNARAGQIMAIWSGSAVNFTETTTTDFGSTSGLSLGVYIVAGAMRLTASAATAGWNIKTIVRSI